MNHLAHLFFADRTPESLLGNLAGDFFKGPIRDDWPAPIADAVRLHRAVDAFTDAHPVVGISRRRLEADFRHYGRVLVDVFYDHYLAVKWDEYADESLDSFVPSVYELLRRNDALLPEAIVSRFRRMADDDWLRSYLHVEGVRTALYYMSRRLERTFALDRAADDLRDRYVEFEEDFQQFFPQAIQYVAELKRSVFVQRGGGELLSE